MAITFREDADLHVLAGASKDDLKALVDYLTLDKDGKPRIAGQLLNDERFKAANGDYPRAWESIAAELQLFGGNTLVNLIRRNGVTYSEILSDVCDHLSLKIDTTQKAYEIENELLRMMVAKTWADLPPDAQEEWAKAMGLGSASSKTWLEAILAAILSNPFASYQASALISRGMAYAIFGNLVRYAGIETGLGLIGGRALGLILGPLGMALAGIFTIPLLTGPAYRVTVPSIMQIAFIRRKLIQADRY